MKVLKKVILSLMLLPAFISEAQTLVVDTIIRQDTILVREVITRQDIIHRTEKVVRYEEKKISGSEFVVNGSDLPANLLIPDSIGQEKVLSSEEIILNEEEVMTSSSPASASMESMLPKKEGGVYIWVPDSMKNLVNDYIEGRRLPIITKIEGTSSRLGEEIDPDEKVLFRGDTIPMILKDRNLGRQRFDRGLFNFLFIPKGIWQIGLTASYGEFSTENLQILDLVSDVDFRGHIFSIRPYFAYFLKSNISLGMRLGYTSGNASIGSFNVDIDDDISFNLKDILYKSKNYSAEITFSQYLGIARRGRFGIFNEVALGFASGSSDFHRPYNGDMRMTHTTTWEGSLNFSPGVCVYVLDKVSFNISFGVFGLNIKHEKQKVNGEYLGERTTSGANFRFNIFNINFGIAVNL